MSTTNNTLGVTLPSFSDLLATLSDEKKMAESKAKVLGIKKEAKLSGLVKAAQIAKINAEEALTAALLSEHGDEASAVKAVIDASKTLEFYEAIYSALFPNA